MYFNAKLKKQSWLNIVVHKFGMLLIMFILYYINVINLKLQILSYYGCLLFIEQQKTESQHFTSRPFIQRRPGHPTMVPSKNHVSSPLTNQLASINALFNSTQSQALLQGHSHSTPITTASGSSCNSSSATRSSINDMSGHSNVGPGNTSGTKLSITLTELVFWRENTFLKKMFVTFIY